MIITAIIVSFCLGKGSSVAVDKTSLNDYPIKRKVDFAAYAKEARDSSLFVIWNLIKDILADESAHRVNKISTSPKRISRKDKIQK